MTSLILNNWLLMFCYLSRYTYGKAVKGTLKMEMCFKADWQSSYYDVRPCAKVLEKVILVIV